MDEYITPKCGVRSALCGLVTLVVILSLVLEGVEPTEYALI